MIVRVTAAVVGGREPRVRSLGHIVRPRWHATAVMREKGMIVQITIIIDQGPW